MTNRLGGDLSLRRGLDVATEDSPDVVFEAPAGGAEGVANGQVHVGIGAWRGLVTDVDLSARDAERNADGAGIAVAAPPVRSLDDDLTSLQPAVDGV
jgi:hypothetical protein